MICCWLSEVAVQYCSRRPATPWNVLAQCMCLKLKIHITPFSGDLRFFMSEYMQIMEKNPMYLDEAAIHSLKFCCVSKLHSTKKLMT